MPFVLMVEENQRESMTRTIGNNQAFLNHVYGKTMEKMWRKAPWDYSASFWTNNCPIPLRRD